MPNPLLGDTEWLFSGFCFLAAVFLFSLPLSLPFTLWLLGRLGSSVYPPRLCRASLAADPPLASAREMKRQSLAAPAVCTVSWAPRKCLTPRVETEYFLLGKQSAQYADAPLCGGICPQPLSEGICKWIPAQVGTGPNPPDPTGERGLDPSFSYTDTESR